MSRITNLVILFLIFQQFFHEASTASQNAESSNTAKRQLTNEEPKLSKSWNFTSLSAINLHPSVGLESEGGENLLPNPDDFAGCQEPFQLYELSGETSAERNANCMGICQTYRGVLLNDGSAFCYTGMTRAWSLRKKHLAKGVTCECGLEYDHNEEPGRCNPSRTFPGISRGKCPSVCRMVILLLYERKIIDCGTLFESGRRISPEALKGFPVKVQVSDNPAKYRYDCGCFLPKEKIKSFRRSKDAIINPKFYT